MIKKARLVAKIVFENLVFLILKIKARTRQRKKIQLANLLAKLKRKNYKLRLALLRQRLKRLKAHANALKSKPLFFQYPKRSAKAVYTPALPPFEARILANSKTPKLKN